MKPLHKKYQDKFDKAFALLDSIGQNKDNKRVPTEEEIKQAELQLGLTFPPSYRYFLQHASKYNLPFDEVAWVGSKGETYREITALNLEERTYGLTDFTIAVFADGYGNHVCFHSGHQKKDGEYGMVFVDHEAEPLSPGGSYRLCANDFADWFLDEVTEQVKQNQDG